ncbi:MAG TPA: glycolate oxidase subunit GlcE [Phenylobacterium sp.]|jgi:glycolate oxidase FAD binding subunit|uniref:glycolate oxidase subunit GlcE n=1 Tax=Phenylobacterium sp. TaxID=1871053 RepID=UPI002B63B22C|nr:glycolate oxidase subunit GlcE [Phenylobacterium sp.]HXA41162.1 glycolate oxidase subunit GlcE [Phenylobacterium sp.]
MPDLAAPTETPKTAEAVCELVAEAGATGRTLEIVGGGTKRSIGAAPAADLVLSLAGLNKVVDYAPEELVLTAQPGVTLAALEKLVADHGQMLPFEPPHLGRLLGAKGRATLGGTLAANLSGPRRIRAGAARDHFLGLQAVTGRGELVKAGGRVVKNVTGYDLPKLIAGSWGTLAVMTEVTIKVLPAARTELTLMLFGLDDRRAGEAMTLALNAPVELSGAAHLPQAAAGRAPLKGEMAVTALRLEGFAASVAARAEHLVGALKGFGRLEQLDGGHSGDFWRQVREVEAFQKDPRPLWRISVPPASGWRVAEAAPGEALYDWGGGLVWLLSQADPRPAVRALGGHATLCRGEGPAFEPLDGALAALTARVKAAFDPKNVLNPGRMGG